MNQIITIVGTKGLSTGDVSAASDAVVAAGGKALPVRWIDEGVAADIGFANADAAAVRDAVEAAIPSADIFVQRTDARSRRLFVADMDSTMITVECIDELADFAGRKAEVSAVTEAAMRGEIDFVGALERRVAALEGLAVTAIEACLKERVRPSPGAATLIATLKANNVQTLLVSGGFTHFTGPVSAALGFDHSLANQLETKDGHLTGQTIGPIVDANAKAKALADSARTLGVDPGAAIAIGDGANDLKMVELAGLGVAYHAKPALYESADARIRNGSLTAILYALGIGQARWVVS